MLVVVRRHLSAAADSAVERMAVVHHGFHIRHGPAADARAERTLRPPRLASALAAGADMACTGDRADFLFTEHDAAMDVAAGGTGACEDQRASDEEEVIEDEDHDDDFGDEDW